MINQFVDDDKIIQLPYVSFYITHEQMAKLSFNPKISFQEINGQRLFEERNPDGTKSGKFVAFLVFE